MVGQFWYMLNLPLNDILYWRAIIRSVSLSTSRTDARAPQATPGKTRELKLPQCYGNNPQN